MRSIYPRIPTGLFYGLLFLCMQIRGEIPEKSRLVEDQEGVLWVEQGKDIELPLIMASRLSKFEPHFVVFVSTTEQHRVQAIAHAQNLAAYFEKHPDAPNQVPVVAHLSPDKTYYYFMIMGNPFFDKTETPNGIMNPKQAQKFREDAVMTFRARMVLKFRGAYKGITLTEVPILRSQEP